MNRRIKRLVTTLRWRLLMFAVRQWAEHELDQWEKIRFKTQYGEIFLTIERKTQYPDSFDSLRD